MANLLSSRYKKLSFLGACLHSGQPIKGVQLAPKAIRNSGVFQSLAEKYEVKVKDYGDIDQVCDDSLRHRSNSPCFAENLHIVDPSLRQLNNRLEKILSQRQEDEVALTVGGDHSIGSSTIHALLGTFPDLKVIWVDAHGDLVVPSEISYKNYHGMPLSHILGICEGKLPGFDWMTRRLKPENVVHIGMRDIDLDEWETLRNSKIKVFTPDHIDDIGIGGVMKKAIEHLDPEGNSPFHISFDIDALDPQYCPSTGTRYRGGLTPREANFIVRKTAFARKLVSMDLVEINPIIEEQKSRLHHRGDENYSQMSSTVGIGVDLIDSIFKRYLSL